jgi:hypothetical protein
MTSFRASIGLDDIQIQLGLSTPSAGAHLATRQQLPRGPYLLDMAA